MLHGHVPGVVTRLQPTGRLAATGRLDLVLGLPLRNREALTNLLEALYDPASTNYHRYLTPEQFSQRFGPTESDYQTLIGFARSNGLTVANTHPNRTLLDVTAAVSDIEKVFHVKLGLYPHPKEARAFFAPDVEPSLDLAITLLGVSGLDNYILPQPMSGSESDFNTAGHPTPAGGSGPGGNYRGNDFRAAYAPGVSLTGAGQTVGLLELDGYYANDITAYENQAGLPNVPLQNVLLDGLDGTPDNNTNWVSEVSLDIEVAIAMAPGLSQVIVYEGTAPLDILNRMATDNLAKQLSSSWFEGGNGDSDEISQQIFQQFVAQGQSFFQASGDFGAFFSGITQRADSPYATIVGGTTLTTTGPGGTWVSETVWKNADGVNSSGGGISGSFPIPSWQQGVSMSANQGSTTQRNSPDVAMVANNVWVIHNNGRSGPFWGTSIAAPLWAAFTALVNQQAVETGKPLVGFINPSIYTIARSAGYGPAFHDITTGDNTSASNPNQFFAVSGFDLCTGWGTPAGAALINSLNSWVVWVTFGNANPGDGTYQLPYNTLARGVAGVLAGGTVLLNGPRSTPETMTISKPLTMQSVGGSATIGQ